MICGEKHIEYRKTGDVFILKPIGDVHFGNASSDVATFRKFIQDTHKNTYYIGMGDLLDCIIPNDPRYQKFIDSAPVDAVLDWQINQMIDMLMPIKDKILGLGSGNHEANILKRYSTDPTQRICEALGVKNLGYTWFYKLFFRQKEGGGRTLTIYGHHGYGTSRTEGGDLTRLSRVKKHYKADLYLFGHTHKKQVDKTVKLQWGKKGVRQAIETLCICGTYLKTHPESTIPSYSEIAGYMPLDIGGLEIRLVITEHGVETLVEL